MNSKIDELREKFQKILKEERERKAKSIKKRNFEFEKQTRTIAQNIKFYRKISDLTQEALAEKLNVDRITIINWENGKYEPVGSQLEDMAKIFEVPIQELHTKTVNNFKETSTERLRFLELENNFRKSHPVLAFTKIQEQKNILRYGDLARDYFWIGSDDIPVIALELLCRGYAVTRVGADFASFANKSFAYDEEELDTQLFEVYLKKSQENSFLESISEIIVDFASNTSSYQEVIKLRQRMIREEKKAEDIIEEDIEEVIRKIDKTINSNEDLDIDTLRRQTYEFTKTIPVVIYEQPDKGDDSIVRANNNNVILGKAEKDNSVYAKGDRIVYVGKLESFVPEEGKAYAAKIGLGYESWFKYDKVLNLFLPY